MKKILSAKINLVSLTYQYMLKILPPHRLANTNFTVKTSACIISHTVYACMWIYLRKHTHTHMCVHTLKNMRFAFIYASSNTNRCNFTPKQTYKFVTLQFLLHFTHIPTDVRRLVFEKRNRYLKLLLLIYPQLY